jgi:hypothetical protein
LRAALSTRVEALFLRAICILQASRETRFKRRIFGLSGRRGGAGCRRALDIRRARFERCDVLRCNRLNNHGLHRIFGGRALLLSITLLAGDFASYPSTFLCALCVACRKRSSQYRFSVSIHPIFAARTSNQQRRQPRDGKSFAAIHMLELAASDEFLREFRRIDPIQASYVNCPSFEASYAA